MDSPLKATPVQFPQQSPLYADTNVQAYRSAVFSDNTVFSCCRDRTDGQNQVDDKVDKGDDTVDKDLLLSVLRIECLFLQAIFGGKMYKDILPQS